MSCALKEHDDAKVLCERCEIWADDNHICDPHDVQLLRESASLGRTQMAQRIRRQRNEYRSRVRMAQVFERDAKGWAQFLTSSESLAVSFATPEHKAREIEWLNRKGVIA